jgi:hypothetical protein
VNDDGTPINQPLPPPPSTTEPDEPVDPWLCDAANQFVDDWIDFYNELTTAGAVAGTSFAVLLPIFIAATILTGGVAAVLAVVVAFTVGPVVQFGEWVNNWLGENRQGLICAMSTALTPAQAYQNVVTYLLAHKGDQNGTFAGEWVENILKPVFQDTDWNLLFEPDSFDIDATNIGSTCPCEGSLIFDIFGDGTWYLVPSLEGEEFVNNNAGYVVGNYLWSFSGSGESQEAQSYPDFPEFLATGKTWLGGGGGQVATTGDHAGYVMQRVGAATGVNTSSFLGAGIIALEAAGYADDDVWTQWQTASDLPKLDFQSGLEAIFDGLSLVHEADRTFSNLDQHRMTMVGVDSSAHATQFRLFAVIAGTALDLS